MNPFAEAQLANAIYRIDGAILHLEGAMGMDETRASLLTARGQLVAMRQLLDLESTIADGVADTERPSGLRVVK